MTEAEARAVLLVRAAEAGAETPLWTHDDRAWATRLTQQTLGADATAERFVVARAGHALQRLLPRDASARRTLARRVWSPWWALGAMLLAFLLGALVDHIGGAQRINLLAPPVWLVIVWNLAVYLALLLPARASGLRNALAQRWLAGRDGFTLAWARHAMPLSTARAALLLHAAAAALALGMIAGMYVRGLVLDYRAGWQSTFLEPPMVQAVLHTLLAPASALTGIGVPDAGPLRVLPGTPTQAPAQAPAQALALGSAAPWIHLYAAMLLLFVVLPRMLLAGAAAWRAHRLARRFPLPLDEPYFERLRLQQQGGSAVVQVLPYAAPCGPQAALGLRAVLASMLGEELRLRIAETTPFDADAPLAADEPGAGLRVLLFDFAATPEAEAQGRFIAACAAQGGALLIVADEAAFQRRFGALPERRVQRRKAWQNLADEQGVGLLCVDLDAPDVARAAAALHKALAR
jgi:hypothetical protein